MARRSVVEVSPIAEMTRAAANCSQVLPLRRTQHMAFEASDTSLTVTPVEFHEGVRRESMCCRISDRKEMFVKNGRLQSCERAATAGSDAEE
jgi:hypothetical protein